MSVKIFKQTVSEITPPVTMLEGPTPSRNMMRRRAARGFKDCEMAGHRQAESIGSQIERVQSVSHREERASYSEVAQEKKIRDAEAKRLRKSGKT